MKIFFLLLASLLLLCGCLPKAPSIEEAKSLPEEALLVAQNDFANRSQLSIKLPIKLPIEDEWPEEKWWEIFHDPELSRLIDLALYNSPTLEEARLRIEKAHLETERARSFLWPFATWTGDFQKNKLSQTGVFPSSPALAPGFTQGPVGPSIPFYYSQFESALNFQYEFDFWGKKSAQIAAKGGEWMSALCLHRFTHLSLALSVSEAYFAFLAATEEASIAQSLVKNRTTYFELIQKRYRANLESKETLLLAGANLQATEKEFAIKEKMADLSLHALLALIASDFQEEIEVTSLVQNEIPKLPIPCSIPLHLIANRPDIQSQLWLIESGLQKIHVAKTRFYPDVDLTGFIGYQTLHLHKFFEWPSVYANATSAFSLPIFDANLRQDELDIAGVETNQLITEYNNLLLKASQEVLDSLSSILSQERQRRAQIEETLFYEQNLKLISLKKEHSIASALNTLEKEKSFLVACQNRIRTEEEMAQSILSLIRALGGGFS